MTVLKTIGLAVYVDSLPPIYARASRRGQFRLLDLYSFSRPSGGFDGREKEEQEGRKNKKRGGRTIDILLQGVFAVGRMQGARQSRQKLGKGYEPFRRGWPPGVSGLFCQSSNEIAAGRAFPTLAKIRQKPFAGERGEKLEKEKRKYHTG